MTEIEKLSLYFSRFPGIGARQARRFVYFLLSGNPQFAQGLSSGIEKLLLRTAQCGECRRYFEQNAGQKNALCGTCIDPACDASTLMIVEKDVDLAAVQKSGAYHGRFFVIGSLIPLKEIKNPSVSPRIGEFLGKVKRNAEKGTLKEVILALSATPEGDHTALEIKILLKPLQERYAFAVSLLGRGLSTGSELEYSDGETLRSALDNRKS